MAQNQWPWQPPYGTGAFNNYQANQMGMAWAHTTRPEFKSSPTYQGHFPNACYTREFQNGEGDGYHIQDQQYGCDSYSTLEYQYGYDHGHQHQDQPYGHEGYSNHAYNGNFGGHSTPQHQFGYGDGYRAYNNMPQHEAPQPSPIPDQEEIYNMMKLLLEGQKAAANQTSQQFEELQSNLERNEHDNYNKLEMLDAKLTYMESQQDHTYITEDSGNQEWGDFYQNKDQAAPAEWEEHITSPDDVDQIAEERVEPWYFYNENSYGDKLEREEEESNSTPRLYEEETGQDNESWCNAINEHGPECYREVYEPEDHLEETWKYNNDSAFHHKVELEEEDFTLEEEQDHFVEPYHEDKPFGEDAPIEIEEEEKSHEEVVNEIELLMGCTIDDDLVIRYEDEADHITIIKSQAEPPDDRTKHHGVENPRPQRPRSSSTRPNDYPLHIYPQTTSSKENARGKTEVDRLNQETHHEHPIRTIFQPWTVSLENSSCSDHPSFVIRPQITYLKENDRGRTPRNRFNLEIPQEHPHGTIIRSWTWSLETSDRSVHFPFNIHPETTYLEDFDRGGMGHKRTKMRVGHETSLETMNRREAQSNSSFTQPYSQSLSFHHQTPHKCSLGRTKSEGLRDFIIEVKTGGKWCVHMGKRILNPIKQTGAKGETSVSTAPPKLIGEQDQNIRGKKWFSMKTL